MIRENKYNGYLKVDNLTFNISNTTISRELVNKKSAVAALVYNTITRKLILVNQWRPGHLDNLTEIVAGVIDNDDDIVDTIRREILEEIGYKVDETIHLFGGYTSPGFTNEYVDIFYCEVSDKVSNGGGLDSENEFINIIEMDIEDFLTTQFIDIKTILSQLWFKAKLKK